jgi:hypothetical protein
MQSKSSFNLHKKAIKSFSSTTFSPPTFEGSQNGDGNYHFLFHLNSEFSCFPFSSHFISGRPPPQVRWLINGMQVDDQTEQDSGDVIENRLLWPSVQRSDLNSIFTCQALNTKLVEPKETSFVLDMNCEFHSEQLVYLPSLLKLGRIRECRLSTCARRQLYG